MTEALLLDRRVLVVEDEYLIAEAMSRGLRRAGAIVLGPVGNLTSALAILESEQDIDAAVLDINLGEQKVYPVADRLIARGTRCIFATGNDPADVPASYASITRCEKPVDPGCIAHALTGAEPLAITPAKHTRQPSLEFIRDQLLHQVSVSIEMSETLLSAKLCEALDAVEARLQGEL